jgi:hypothetical protein
MKTETITVNKTAQNPDGLQIEIVKPQTSLEQRVLSYLLVGQIKQAKERGALPYDLPENFSVEYLREGTFLASAQGAQSPGSFYEPPRPIAIFGIRTVSGGRRFDLIHADAKRQTDQKKGAEQSGPMNMGPDEPDDDAAGEGEQPAEAVSQQGEAKE